MNRLVRLCSRLTIWNASHASRPRSRSYFRSFVTAGLVGASAVVGGATWAIVSHPGVSQLGLGDDIARKYRWAWGVVYLTLDHDFLDWNDLNLRVRCWIWNTAKEDKSLSPTQLAALTTRLAVMFNSSGDPDTARVIAGAVLRALAQSSPDRRTLDPLSRVRAASVAVSLAYAEDEAPTAWPFMAWAMTEACDNPLGPEDSREFASLSFTVRWDGISWAEWKGRMDDVMPLQIAVYEKYFMTRPYFAADILNDLIVGYISHDELYVAEQLMFRANRLGRVGMALSGHHEPDSGVRIRVTTILYAAQLCEWVADYEGAEQRYLIAREMTRRNLHKVGPRWLQACEAGLLRSRLQTQRVSDWTFAEDFDDEPEY